MSAFNGHILGPKALRQLNNRTGMNFDKASRVTTRYGIGREIVDGKCVHYEIDWTTGQVVPEHRPMHWSTCPKDSR